MIFGKRSLRRILFTTRFVEGTNNKTKVTTKGKTGDCEKCENLLKLAQNKTLTGL